MFQGDLKNFLFAYRLSVFPFFVLTLTFIFKITLSPPQLYNNMYCNFIIKVLRLCKTFFSPAYFYHFMLHMGFIYFIPPPKNLTILFKISVGSIFTISRVKRKISRVFRCVTITVWRKYLVLFCDKTNTYFQTQNRK